MIRVDDHREGAVFTVRVQPAARRAAVLGKHGGLLKVAVREAPERGQANAAVVRLLSQSLGLAKSRVEILSGEGSRAKRILVRDGSADEMAKKLDDSLGES